MVLDARYGGVGEVRVRSVVVSCEIARSSLNRLYSASQLELWMYDMIEWLFLDAPNDNAPEEAAYLKQNRIQTLHFAAVN